MRIYAVKIQNNICAHTLNLNKRIKKDEAILCAYTLN